VLDRATGDNVGSYDISYVSADFSIGRRAVTVTANSGQGQIYGDADPSSYGYTSTVSAVVWAWSALSIAPWERTPEPTPSPWAASPTPPIRTAISPMT
jgi:hypothetical protein